MLNVFDSVSPLSKDQARLELAFRLTKRGCDVECCSTPRVTQTWKQWFIGLASCKFDWII